MPKNEHKVLWKFHKDTYYAYIGGLFIATREELARALGQQVFISEGMGKYGDCEFILTDDLLEFVSDDPDVISIIEPHLPIGYDPLEHMTYLCSSCGIYCEEDFFIVP